MAEWEDEVEERAKQAKLELEQLSDRLAVKANLAEKDARDAWREVLKPRLEQIGRSLSTVAKELRATAEEGRLQAHLGALEARDVWKELEPELRQLGQELEREGEELKPALDRARIQAHLGKLDAEDVIRDRAQKAKARLAEGTEVARTELRKVLDGLLESVEQLRQR